MFAANYNKTLLLYMYQFTRCYGHLAMRCNNVMTRRCSSVTVLWPGGVTVLWPGGVTVSVMARSVMETSISVSAVQR